jgi:molybdate transport system substrate-binding protein
MGKILAAIFSSLVILACGSAGASEVKVLTAGAFRPIVAELSPEFERLTGNKVVELHDTVGGLVRRIEAGESFDLAILSAAAAADLANRGILAEDKTAKLAQVGVGIAVKEGAAQPAIVTVDDFRRLLLDAPSVAYIDPAAGGTSGIYMSRLIEKLGIADAVRRKAVLVQGGLVGDKVAGGEAAVGLQQTSELLAVKGVRVIGPLPSEIQSYTVYAGGVGKTARHRQEAESLLGLFQSEAASAVLKAHGMETPGK